MIGVEALARWNDAERGPIAPDEFIPLAERTGLIRPLSEWAIREASRQAAEWRAAGHDMHVSINIPPDTCQQIGAGAIVAMIERPGLRPVAHHARDDRVRDDGAAARAQATRWRALAAHGIQLAIDDFGTGHSSLGRGSASSRSAC